MPQLVQKALPATNAAVSSVLADTASAVVGEAPNSMPRAAALNNTLVARYGHTKDTALNGGFP